MTLGSEARSGVSYCLFFQSMTGLQEHFEHQSRSTFYDCRFTYKDIYRTVIGKSKYRFGAIAFIVGKISMPTLQTQNLSYSTNALFSLFYRGGVQDH